MLVGLVRAATAWAGCSWTLSGGSQLSSAVTNTSKYRHVCRDSFPRNTRCCSDRRTTGAASVRLSHHATAGETSQIPSSGPAAGSRLVRNRISSKIVVAEIAGATQRDRKKPGRSAQALRVASLDVFHSSSFRFVQNVRTSVRTIASRLMYASYGRKVSVNRNCAPCLPSATVVKRRCVLSGRSVGLQQKSTSTDSKGTAPTTASTKRVAATPSGGPVNTQQLSSSANIATGTRLLRRLSKIFHHDNAVIGFLTRRVAFPGTQCSSHQAICQSPRIQRCRRLTSTG